MIFTTNPQNARIVAAITRTLAAIPIGGTVAYQEISRAAGVKVQDRRDLLHKAREAAETTLGCLYEPVRGIGIRRLEADETPGVGSHAIVGVRRKTKRALTRMVRVNANSLGADARQLTALKLAHLNVLHGLADNRRTRTFVAPANADPYAARSARKE